MAIMDIIATLQEEHPDWSDEDIIVVAYYLINNDR